MKYWRDEEFSHGLRNEDECTLLVVSWLQEWQTDLLENVLTTAVEGGINYWSDVRVVKSGVEYLVSVDGVDVDDFVCHDDTKIDGFDDASGLLTVLLDHDLVWDGLVRLSEAADLDEGCEADCLSVAINKVFDSFGLDQADFLSWLDASGADVVVQYALFGEVIFG